MSTSGEGNRLLRAVGDLPVARLVFQRWTGEVAGAVVVAHARGATKKAWVVAGSCRRRVERRGAVGGWGTGGDGSKRQRQQEPAAPLFSMEEGRRR